MNPFFAFSDESGHYQQQRSEKYLSKHPFYVRATITISMEDYIELQNGISAIKEQSGLSPQTEVKWSDYGQVLKKKI